MSSNGAQNLKEFLQSLTVSLVSDIVLDLPHFHDLLGPKQRKDVVESLQRDPAQALKSFCGLSAQQDIESICAFYLQELIRQQSLHDLFQVESESGASDVIQSLMMSLLLSVPDRFPSFDDHILPDAFVLWTSNWKNDLETQSIFLQRLIRRGLIMDVLLAAEKTESCLRSIVSDLTTADQAIMFKTSFREGLTLNHYEPAIFHVQSILNLSCGFSTDAARVLLRWCDPLSKDVIVDLLLDIFSDPIFIDRSSTTHHLCKPSNSQLYRPTLTKTTVIVELLLLLLPSVEHSTIAHKPKFIDAVSDHLSCADVIKRARAMLLASKTSEGKLHWPADSWVNFEHEQARLDSLSMNSTGIVEAPIDDPSVSERGEDLSSLKIEELDDDSDNDSVLSFDAPAKITAFPNIEPNSDDEEANISDDEKNGEVNLPSAQLEAPVFISQLSPLLRPTAKEARDQAKSISVGLKWAAKLIRRKSAYGSELRDNAVDLCIVIMSLQDNFDLPHFSSRKLDALVSLVVGAPDLVGPCIAEYFFSPQYSFIQRTQMLSALIRGSRILAGLENLDEEQARLLPSTVHRQLSSPREDYLIQRSDSLLLETLRISSQEASTHPLLAKENRLRVNKNASRYANNINSMRLNFDSSVAIKRPGQELSFNRIAGPSLILPMITNYWTHERDEVTRSLRYKNSSGSAGSAILKDQAILSRYLQAQAILLDAARFSDLFLNVLAPESVEMALSAGQSSNSDRAVRESSLQLCLVAISISSGLDAGRAIAKGHTEKLLQVSSFAARCFSEESEAVSENQTQSTLATLAAALCIKTDQIMSKWALFITS